MRRLLPLLLLGVSLLFGRVVELPGSLTPYNDNPPPPPQTSTPLPLPKPPAHNTQQPKRSHSPFQLDQYFPQKYKNQSSVVSRTRPYTGLTEGQARDLQLLYQEIVKAQATYQALYQRFRTKFFKKKAGVYKKWMVRLSSKARGRGLNLSLTTPFTPQVNPGSLQDAFVEAYKVEKRVGAFAKKALRNAPKFLRTTYRVLLDETNKAREDIKCVLRLL